MSKDLLIIVGVWLAYLCCVCTVCVMVYAVAILIMRLS